LDDVCENSDGSEGVLVIGHDVVVLGFQAGQQAQDFLPGLGTLDGERILT